FGLLGVLVFMGIGGLYKYEGQKIIVEGEGFTNNLVSYDSFTPGTAFAEDRLAPFAVQLEDFDVVFDRESEAHYGQALEYTATMPRPWTLPPGPATSLMKAAPRSPTPLPLSGSACWCWVTATHQI